MNKKVVYKNKWFNIIEIPCNHESEPYYGLETLDYVQILAITNENDVLFVRQHRPLLQTFTLELPGGHVEQGQTPEKAALVELNEETGYNCVNLELLGTLQTDVGRLTNKLWCYLARELKEDKNWIGEERIEVVKHPLNNLNQLVRSGQVENAFNLATFFLAYPKIIKS